MHALELGGENLTTHASLAHPDLVAAVMNARGVTAVSDGPQKEAFILRFRCTTVRTETEQVQTVELGWNKLGEPGPALTEAANRSRPPTRALPLRQRSRYCRGCLRPTMQLRASGSPHHRRHTKSPRVQDPWSRQTRASWHSQSPTGLGAHTKASLYSPITCLGVPTQRLGLVMRRPSKRTLIPGKSVGVMVL